MEIYRTKPAPFLELVIHEIEPLPGLTGMCAGYERGEWRCTRLVEHLLEWLPEFALNSAELQALNHGNCLYLLRQAARNVYATEKYQRRGEVGEILLHAVIRQVFDSVPAISKIYYKDSNNDTVKGFDAVHVVRGVDGLELWLGEVKFYSDIGRAIRDVTNELYKHMETDFLRCEFAAIRRKLDRETPFYEELSKLFHENTSLDQVFRRLCVPVLLTYDSPTVNACSTTDEAYQLALDAELRDCYKVFCDRELPLEIRIHLFLIPLKDKAIVSAHFDECLKGLAS